MERNEISNMKRCLQVVCTAVFILLCLGTMCFLQFFIKTDMSIRYIDWQSSVKIETDGSESSLDYTVVPQTGESFRLETVFPPTEETGIWCLKRQGWSLRFVSTELRYGTPRPLSLQGQRDRHRQ